MTYPLPSKRKPREIVVYRTINETLLYIRASQKAPAHYLVLMPNGDMPALTERETRETLRVNGARFVSRSETLDLPK